MKTLFSVFVVAVLLAFGASHSFAQDTSPIVSAYVQDDGGGVPIVSDAVMAPFDQAITPTRSVKVIPVADGIVQYRARVRCAYWPLEHASKANTKGFPWLHLERADRVSRV
jgi:hypothetical protein